MPSTSTETLPADLSSAASTAGSAAVIAAATALVPFPNRRPRVRKFGFTT